MASKHSAARPKRAGETFARQHHGEQGSDDEAGLSGSAAKKVKFDVRNPSALAPDAREEDEILDADVIGVAGAATKRGAVNIDGYDSDSENETFNARAEQREKKAGKVAKGGAHVDIIDQLDNYDKTLKGEADNEAEDDEDMFGGDDDGEEDNEAQKSAGGKRDKAVRFLDNSNIQGQEDTSKSGGHIRLDDGESSDDEDVELEIREEGVDEEVGLGGLKKHAPKIDAFNMRQEQEEGAFDESGNFIRKAVDPDAVHDRWLEGMSKKQIRLAAEAQEKRDEEARRQRREDDSIMTGDLIAALISRLELGETPLEALARLARGAAKTKAKKIPQWKRKKQSQSAQSTQNGEAAAADAMDVDKAKAPDDPQEARRKADIVAITEAADRLLNRDYPTIYDKVREWLVREFRAETGSAWEEPARPSDGDGDAEAEAGVGAAEPAAASARLWEFRWVDGRDGGKIQGPFDGATMKAWQDAKYFGEGIEFRPAGEHGSWSRGASFV